MIHQQHEATKAFLCRFPLEFRQTIQEMTLSSVKRYNRLKTMVKLNLSHSHVAIIAIGFSEKGIKSASEKLSKASQNAILKICQPVYNF